MASFRKVGNQWRAEVRRKNPDFYWSDMDVSKTALSFRAAEVEAEWKSGKRGGIPKKTVGQLLDRYVDEVSATKKGERNERSRAGSMQRDPLALVLLSELSTTHISAYRDRRLKVVSGSSVNREMSLLSHVFTTAVREWKWLIVNPCKGVRLPKENEPRSRTITDDEITLLRLQLGEDVRKVSGRVCMAFLFALETGMRAGEICWLPIKSVNGKAAYLPPEIVKTGKGRHVPLSAEALRLISLMPPAEVGGVFGVQPSQVESLFRKARNKLAETMPTMREINFHDTRHTAATRLAKKLNLLELCAMFGFKPDVAQRVYVNLDAQDIARKL